MHASRRTLGSKSESQSQWYLETIEKGFLALRNHISASFHPNIAGYYNDHPAKFEVDYSLALFHTLASVAYRSVPAVNYRQHNRSY
jgi:hypothetical protein